MIITINILLYIFNHSCMHSKRFIEPLQCICTLECPWEYDSLMGNLGTSINNVMSVWIQLQHGLEHKEWDPNAYFFYHKKNPESSDAKTKTQGFYLVQGKIRNKDSRKETYLSDKENKVFRDLEMRENNIILTKVKINKNFSLCNKVF